MTTCGLTHFGPPETDENEERGLHGRISNIPASIESVIQPDPANGKFDMSITGLMKQSKIFGPNLELRRTISSTLGEPTIRIHDVVTNRGNTRIAHMFLYHCNFGFPLVDEGADIVWKGKWQSRGLDMDNAIFNDKHNFRKCQKPLEIHRGSEEAVAFIDVTADSDGICTVGFHNSKLNMALMMRYKKEQLPVLSNWQHWGIGEYVTGLEPGTNPPTGQNKAREEGKLIYLGAGESRSYDLELTVLTGPDQIAEFLKVAAP